MTAIYDFLMNTYESLDNGDVTTGIFIDLSKAFDTVNYEKLLYKLHCYGIEGKLHELLKSYLTDRKQQVYKKTKNGSALSSLSTMSEGIP